MNERLTILEKGEIGLMKQKPSYYLSWTTSSSRQGAASKSMNIT
jgi:hypothetical protein